MNWKAVTVSSIYFLCLLVFTIPVIESLMVSNIIVATAIVFFVWVSPGYLVAHLSKKSGVLNAVVAGLIVTLLGLTLSAVLNVESELISIISNLLMLTIFWFGLGAVIWHIQLWFKQRRT